MVVTSRSSVEIRSVHPSVDSRPPDITVVAHEIHYSGGMERVHARIVEHLLEREWRVHVVARVCEVPPHPHLSWTRVRTPRSPFLLAYPLFAISGSLKLARRHSGVITTCGAIVLARADIATVHFCHHGFARRASVTSRGRTGLVHSVNQWLAAHLARAMERWCYHRTRVQRLVAVSSTIASELREAFPDLSDRVNVIPNGVDLQRFRPDAGRRAKTREQLGLSPDARVALFVGGDWGRKGLDVAVAAIGSRPEWQLLVVGPGDEGSLRRMAQAVGATDRVIFTGFQTDTSGFYPAADVFMLPTAYEGFPLVTLEAAAAGLPLLVTEVAGTDGLLTPGVNGWVLEREPAAFAACLDRLGDEAVVERMGRAAREAVAKFSWPDIGDAHAEVYREISHNQPAT